MALLLVAVAAGAFLRFFHLSDKPFWAAEVQEIIPARSDRWDQMILDAGMDLIGYGWHHLMWMFKVREDLEFWHRLLSVLCSIATIPVVYLLGKRVCSRVAGGAAAFLAAVAFVFVNHAQDVRSISCEAFGAAACYLAMVHVVLDRSLRWSVLFVIGSLFLALSHGFGFLHFFLIGLTFFCIAWQMRRKAGDTGPHSPMRLFLLSYMFGSVAASFQLISVAAFMQFTYFVDPDRFAAHADMTHQTGLKASAMVLTYFTGFSGLLLIPVAIVALFGVASLWIRDRGIASALLAWVALPSILFLVARLLGKLPHLDLYHVVYLLPGFCVIFGAGLHALVSVVLYVGKVGNRPRWRAVAVALIAVTIGVWGNASLLARYYERDIRLFLGNDFRAAARFVDEQGVEPEDTLAFLYSEHFYVMNFYMGRLFRPNAALTLALDDKKFRMDRIRLHSQDVACTSDIPIISFEKVKSVDDFAKGSYPYTGTVWTVLPQDESLGDLHGLTSYSRWFTMDQVFLNTRKIRVEDLAPGFRLKTFPGVVVMWKKYEDAERSLVASEIHSLLLEYAPAMSRAYYAELRDRFRGSRSE